MMDHVFTDVIGAFRIGLDTAPLQQLALEDRFQSDVLLGDLRWESSYTLADQPEEPGLRADVSLEWSTWSQTAYRSWYLDEGLEELPRVDIAVVFRRQHINTPPPVEAWFVTLPELSVDMDGQCLARQLPTVEIGYTDQLIPAHYAFEAAYEGTYELSESALDEAQLIEADFSRLGNWVADQLRRFEALAIES